jgi:hypothetical protein
MNQQHLSALRCVIPGLHLWRRNGQEHHYRRNDSPVALCGVVGGWGAPVPPHPPCRDCAEAIGQEIDRAIAFAAMPLFAESCQ